MKNTILLRIDIYTHKYPKDIAIFYFIKSKNLMLSKDKMWFENNTKGDKARAKHFCYSYKALFRRNYT